MERNNLKAHIVSGIWGALTSYMVVMCFAVFLFAAALIPVNEVAIAFGVLLAIAPIIIGSASGLLAFKLAGSHRRSSTFWIAFPGVIIGILFVFWVNISILEKQDRMISLNLLRILDASLWIVSGIIVEVLITGSLYLYKLIWQVRQ